jgi:hypothetical protein
MAPITLRGSRLAGLRGLEYRILIVHSTLSQSIRLSIALTAAFDFHVGFTGPSILRSPALNDQPVLHQQGEAAQGLM